MSLLNLEVSIALVSNIFNFCATVLVSACPCKLENLTSSAACVKMLIGLSKSFVLSTLPNPTLEALIPVEIFVSVTALLPIFSVVIAPVATTGMEAVPLKSPANFMTPLLIASASVIFVVELLFPPFATIAEST